MSWRADRRPRCVVIERSWRMLSSSWWASADARHVDRLPEGDDRDHPRPSHADRDRARGPRDADHPERHLAGVHQDGDPGLYDRIHRRRPGGSRHLAAGDEPAAWGPPGPGDGPPN